MNEEQRAMGVWFEELRCTTLLPVISRHRSANLGTTTYSEAEAISRVRHVINEPHLHLHSALPIR